MGWQVVVLAGVAVFSPPAGSAEDIQALAPAIDVTRIGGAMLATLLAVWWVDRRIASGRFFPPGFHQPWRRLAAAAALFVVFLVGIFAPAAMLGLDLGLDLEALQELSSWDLFAMARLLTLALGAWYLLGYVGVGVRGAAWGWLGQFGLRARRPQSELVVGVVAGLGAWAAALAAALLLAAVVGIFAGEDFLQARESPEEIVWMAGLPVVMRILLSLSAGIFEEIFFRGFLQPRVGVGLSAAFFAAAHLGYGEPMMLAGIIVLSLIYAALARWRGNILAAITAHVLFDLVQLLVVIPAALAGLEASGAAVAVLP